MSRVWDIFIAFMRSFLMQALWNFERMQNVGMVYSVLPYVRKLYPDAKIRTAVLRRYFEFFNTHPYMAHIVVGLTMAGERDVVQRGGTGAEALDTMRRTIAGPLAAIGDTFFWATWRPFAALVTIAIYILFCGKAECEHAILLSALFLSIYNGFSLPFRLWGISAGYMYGSDVVAMLVKLNVQGVKRVVQAISRVMLVVVTVYYVYCFAATTLLRVEFGIAWFAVVMLASMRINSTAIFYVTVAAVVGLQWVK